MVREVWAWRREAAGPQGSAAVLAKTSAERRRVPLTVLPTRWPASFAVIEILHRHLGSDSPNDDVGSQDRDCTIEACHRGTRHAKGNVCCHQHRRGEGDAAGQSSCTRSAFGETVRT